MRCLQVAPLERQQTETVQGHRQVKFIAFHTQLGLAPLEPTPGVAEVTPKVREESMVVVQDCDREGFVKTFVRLEALGVQSAGLLKRSASWRLVPLLDTGAGVETERGRAVSAGCGRRPRGRSRPRAAPESGAAQPGRASG